MHTHDRGGQIGRGGGAREHAVDAVLDQLDCGVVGLAHEDARRSAGRSLDHDHAVALASRGQDHGGRAPQSVVNFVRRHEAGRGDKLAVVERGDPRQHLGPLRSVAEQHGVQTADLLGGERRRVDHRRRPLLGDHPPGEHDEKLGLDRFFGHRRAGVLAFQDRHLAAQALLAKARGVQSREAERPLSHARTATLHRHPGRSQRAEVFTPVPGRPDLVPVDNQLIAAERAHECRGQ